MRSFETVTDLTSQELLQALPLAAYICDLSGRITMFNDAAASLWGRTPSLEKESWSGAWKIFHLDGVAIKEKEIHTAILINEKRAVEPKEFVIQRPDDSKRFIIEQPQLLVNAKGEVIGSLTLLNDISHSKTEEQHIAHLRAIFESSEDAIISKTLNGIITSWNPGAERLLGYSASEMIGESIAKIIPSNRINEEPLIIQRIVRGERVEHFDTIRKHKNGKLIDISLTISPVKDSAGNIIGASKIARDITAQKSLNKALSESEKRFRHMVMQSPIAMLVMSGPEFIVDIANSSYLEVIDRRAKDFIGKPLLKGLPELESQGIGELLNTVFKTGVPFYGNEYPVELLRNGQLQKVYFNFVYQPSFDIEGKVTGITVIAFDVTALVKSKHAIEESEKQFRNMVLQSPIAMSIFRGPDYVIEMANIEMIKNVWRKQESNLIGKKALDVFPELRDQKYPDLLKQVLTTGIAYRESESLAYLQGDDGMKKFYLDYHYSPLFEADGSISGVMITVNDVTSRVEAIKQLEDAEARLRLAADGTGLATWDLDLKTREIIFSPKLSLLFGHDQSKVLTHQQMRDQIHPEDRQSIVEKAFDQAMKTSKYFYEARVVWPDKTIRWIHTLGKVYFDDQQKPQRMLGTMRDVTREKISQEAIAESEQRLNLAIDAAELGTWELNLKTKKLIYSKRYQQMFGIESNDNIEHSDFLKRMHPDDLPIRQSAFEEAMKTGVLNYESRLIWEDKTIRWVKAKGKLFHNEQNIPDRLLGTIQDITDRKTIEEELEKRVSERTAELQRVNLKLEHSNQELEQYAYVASHDLQEPLRKIRTYSGLLHQNLLGKADTVSINTLEKVISSAERMSTLIYDLLNFSRLLKPETSFESVDLNIILKNVMSDLELLIQQKQVDVHISELPVIEGIELQTGQLFYNLVNNSIKFSKKEEIPVIKIRSRTISMAETLNNKNLNPQLSYFEIIVSDNGIGFDQENAEQIFEVFKRLHNKTAYPGSGIGLALCRKISLNHQGDIQAVRETGKGATFHLFLPVRQK